MIDVEVREEPAPPKKRTKEDIEREKEACLDPRRFRAAVMLYDAFKPVKPPRRRIKTACKNRPHLFKPVMKKLTVWPYEIEEYRMCTRCGRKKKGVILT